MGDSLELIYIYFSIWFFEWFPRACFEDELNEYIFNESGTMVKKSTVEDLFYNFR